LRTVCLEKYLDLRGRKLLEDGRKIRNESEKIREDGMGKACVTYYEDEEGTQNFSRETSREERILDT
jgi:hypothetical protein